MHHSQPIHSRHPFITRGTFGRLCKWVLGAGVLVTCFNLPFWLSATSKQASGTMPDMIGWTYRYMRREVLRMDGQDIRRMDYSVFICSENWEVLDASERQALRDRLPPRWQLGEDKPTRVSRDTECVNCSVACLRPGWSTPLISVVNSNWWQASLSGQGYRHWVLRLGPWQWVIASQSTGAS